MNKFLQLKNISKNFNTEKKIKVLKNLSYDFSKGKRPNGFFFFITGCVNLVYRNAYICSI